MFFTKFGWDVKLFTKFRQGCYLCVLLGISRFSEKVFGKHKRNATTGYKLWFSMFSQGSGMRPVQRPVV